MRGCLSNVLIEVIIDALKCPLSRRPSELHHSIVELICKIGPPLDVVRTSFMSATLKVADLRIRSNTVISGCELPSICLMQCLVPAERAVPASFGSKKLCLAEVGIHQVLNERAAILF